MSLLGQLTASSSQFINKRGIYLGRRSTKLHVAPFLAPCETAREKGT